MRILDPWIFRYWTVFAALGATKIDHHGSLRVCQCRVPPKFKKRPHLGITMLVGVALNFNWYHQWSFLTTFSHFVSFVLLPFPCRMMMDPRQMLGQMFGIENKNSKQFPWFCSSNQGSAERVHLGVICNFHDYVRTSTRWFMFFSVRQT